MGLICEIFFENFTSVIFIFFRLFGIFWDYFRLFRVFFGLNEDIWDNMRLSWVILFNRAVICLYVYESVIMYFCLPGRIWEQRILSNPENAIRSMQGKIQPASQREVIIIEHHSQNA